MLPGGSREVLYHLARGSWVGYVLCRSCTTYHNGRWGSRWSRWSTSWPVRRVKYSQVHKLKSCTICMPHFLFLTHRLWDYTTLHYTTLCLFFFFGHHFYFPAQLGGSLSLSDLLDKPWSQVSSLPPGTCLQFLSRIGLAFPLLVDFHRMLLTHALALSANQFLSKKKSLRVCAHSENWTREIDFSRHEDNPPSHRGCRHTHYTTN